MIKWPNDYRILESAGLIDKLTDTEDPLIVWDAEFMSVNQISSFEPLSDQLVDIVPFAMTCSGDYWAYLADHLPDSGIVLCYRDSYEAEYFASNLSQFIFRQTVAFAGCEDLSSVTSGWNAKTAREMISLVCLSFKDFIPRSMIKELDRIATRNELRVDDGCTTLIPETLANQLIDNFVVFNRDEPLFEWRA